MKEKIAYSLLAITALAATGAVYSQSSKHLQKTQAQQRMMPITCGTAADMKTILDKYEEKIVFTSPISSDNSPKGVSVLSLNRKTETWTFFEIYEDGIACLITAGSEGKLVGISI